MQLLYAWEKNEKIGGGGGERETNMLSTYHELEVLTYLFNLTIIPILQMKKLRLS